MRGLNAVGVLSFSTIILSTADDWDDEPRGSRIPAPEAAEREAAFREARRAHYAEEVQRMRELLRRGEDEGDGDGDGDEDEDAMAPDSAS